MHAVEFSKSLHLKSKSPNAPKNNTKKYLQGKINNKCIVHWLKRQRLPIFKHNFQFVIRKSSISGNGVFTKKNIKKHELIGMAFTKIASTAIPDLNYKGTTLGKMVNHSGKPNLYFSSDHQGSIFYYAKRYISKNEELLIDYNEFPFDGVRNYF